MRGNNIEGSIPKNLARLRKLKMLVLNENLLTGTLPVAVFELPELEILQLQGNHLNKVQIGNMALRDSDLVLFDYEDSSSKIDKKNVRSLFKYSDTRTADTKFEDDND